MFAFRNIDLRQEGYPAEDVLAEVAHGAAGERGVRVDVLVVVEPLGKFNLEQGKLLAYCQSFESHQNISNEDIKSRTPMMKRALSQILV